MLNENEKKIFVAALKKLMAIRLTFKDSILGAVCATTIGTALTSRVEKVYIEKRNDYSQELNKCQAVVSKCEENAMQVDVQIKAIFEATKEQLCPSK